MIGKLVRRMMVAQTLSALTVSLCLLIDNIMIGRFLGVEALAAYGLANPVLLVLAAVASWLSAGVQVACSRSLGKGSTEETNSAYSTAIVTCLVFSGIFVLLVALLRVPLAGMLGAGEPRLLSDTSDYMLGFVIGAPATMGALALIPFLQIAGKNNLLVVAVLGMTVADVAFDLVSVLVFKDGLFGMGPLFGMGLASALSYYTAILVAIGYFLSKKCVFRFSKAGVKLKKLREFITGGAPTMVGMAASVVLVFIMNQILLGAGENGDLLVAAFSIMLTIGGTCNCVSTGTAGVSLTLSGIFWNEEDRSSLGRIFFEIIRTAVIMGAAVMVLMLIFAPACSGLYLPDAADQNKRDIVTFALRCFSLGLIPCCINNALRSHYQGTGRVKLMQVISVLENTALPVIAALIGRYTVGADGAWFYFLAGELLTLVLATVHVWIQKKRVTWKADDILLLKDDFGVPPEDLLETDIHGLDDVMAASRKAEEFCRSHQGSNRLSTHLALCVEEMGTNIVTHGFKEEKKNHLAIRLQHKDGRWTLRFRDDCMAFDPVSHISKNADSSDSVGIRLAMKMADEARYTYSMNLNNLVLILRDE